MTEVTAKKPTRTTKVKEDAVVEMPINEELKENSALEEFLTHQRQALTSSGKALESLLPEGVRTHGQKAVEEMIEGYRVLFNNAVDSVVDRVRKTEANLGDIAERVQKVRIEDKNKDQRQQ